jgi:DNA-binding LacI/PurR family transcriptional regulator
MRPYVTYDWQAEAERLFRIAVARGRRSLAVVGSYPRKALDEMCRRSAQAAGLARRDIRLTCLHCEPSTSGSPLVARAYQAALGAFSNGPRFDCLLITGDYEAIGVTDALVSLPPARWHELDILALLNKESRLHARIPMTALVSDGYACGMALADMVHEQITTGGDCQSGVILSCSQVQWG